MFQLKYITLLKEVEGIHHRNILQRTNLDRLYNQKLFTMVFSLFELIDEITVLCLSSLSSIHLGLANMIL